MSEYRIDRKGLILSQVFGLREYDNKLGVKTENEVIHSLRCPDLNTL